MKKEEKLVLGTTGWSSYFICAEGDYYVVYYHGSDGTPSAAGDYEEPTYIQVKKTKKLSVAVKYLEENAKDRIYVKPVLGDKVHIKTLPKE
jgi:hypothetical protein